MSQYDPYQPAPPPPDHAGQQPAHGQTGYQPRKTNTMAVLGLVCAFVVAPLGIVFSAIGLQQTRDRREGGRGIALAGLILSIVFLVVGILVAVLALTVFSAANRTSQSDSAAASSARATNGAAPADDPTGVVAACQVIVPAVVNLESDLSTVTSPEEYATVLGGLRTTIEAAAGRSTDQAFIAHVKALSADFQQAIDAVSAGEDPSSLAPALTADGTQIDTDCAAAGYVQ